jgi:hypothetical protein
LGPESFHHVCAPGQEARPARRARRCLLKDCEQWFEPARPQSRYCSANCAAAAWRWRCVKASRAYRASDNGRERRREQNRRYRERRGERAAAEMPTLSADTAAAACEGQRPASGDENLENFCQRMCDRPGCYAVFVVKNEHACQRFCSLGCRLALRRVLDREARYRQRRWRWRRERMTRAGHRPDTS